MKTAIALLILVSSLNAGTIYLPPDISPGETYQLVFTTEGIHNAHSSDISVYNNFVQHEAEKNGVVTGTEEGVTWKAIFSTSTTNARDNARITSPVFRLDGKMVADGFDDFWDGSIDHAMVLDQFGVASLNSNIGAPRGWAFTGTDQDGRYKPSTGGVSTGYMQLTAYPWISNTGIAPNNTLPFYALSSPIVATVPEPSTLALLILGLVCCIRKNGRNRHEQRT